MVANPIEVYVSGAMILVVFFAQVFKELGIPSPGLTQSLLFYAGYQFSHGGYFFGAIIILSTYLGSICGAGLIFHLARWGRNAVLEKYERWIVIRPEAIKKTMLRMENHSFITVVLGRSIPGMMVPTSIVAGSMRIPLGKFYSGIVFTLTLWIMGLTILGGTFGHITFQIDGWPNRAIIPVVIIMAAGILVGVALFRRKGWKINLSFGRIKEPIQ
jgi:membrane protein DedA with SNARE-associated domain